MYFDVDVTVFDPNLIRTVYPALDRATARQSLLDAIERQSFILVAADYGKVAGPELLLWSSGASVRLRVDEHREYVACVPAEYRAGVVPLHKFRDSDGAEAIFAEEELLPLPLARQAIDGWLATLELPQCCSWI